MADIADKASMEAKAKVEAAKTVMRNVSARKQVLRDAPADPRIETAKTVDDLLKLMPPVEF